MKNLAVASYRLMPQINLLEEITDERARTLAKIYPKAIKVSKKRGIVIYCFIFIICHFEQNIECWFKKKNFFADREVAKVINQRNIICNRNIFFHDELKDAVEVTKIKDHYICKYLFIYFFNIKYNILLEISMPDLKLSIIKIFYMTKCYVIFIINK